MSTFEIDFFELQFLAEACIPPAPIARTMFFEKLIDEIYFDLNEAQREQILESVSRDRDFQRGNDMCRLFAARYHKNNQYKVWTRHNGEIDEHLTFLHDGEFRLKSNKMVNKESIFRVEQLHRTTESRLMPGDWVYVSGYPDFSTLNRVKWYRSGFYYFDTVLTNTDEGWTMDTYMSPEFEDSYHKFVINGVHRNRVNVEKNLSVMDMSKIVRDSCGEFHNNGEVCPGYPSEFSHKYLALDQARLMGRKDVIAVFM